MPRRSSRSTPTFPASTLDSGRRSPQRALSGKDKYSYFVVSTGGTYIVETVFSYPGLGTLSYESARYQDYNLLMVLCMMTGAAVIVCNLLAQAISARIDPRLAGEEAAHG